MERKIGEVFEFENEKYIIIESLTGCAGCFAHHKPVEICKTVVGHCATFKRSDNKTIIASKLSDFERSKIQTINSLWEKYVENEVELIFKDKNDVTGVDKSAMKASLKLKMDDFMFKFIKQIAQNEDI